MDSNETLAVVVNERQEVFLLLIVHVQLAGRVEQHRVEMIQVLGIAGGNLLLGQELSVGSDVRFIEPGFAAQSLDGRKGVRYRVVLESFYLADRQQALPLDLRILGDAESGEG